VGTHHVECLGADRPGGTEDDDVATGAHPFILPDRIEMACGHEGD
jgi:hypothetical protein